MSHKQQLLDLLEVHEPVSRSEADSLRRMRSLVRWLPRPFDEHADPTHVTGSAIVVADDGRFLLHKHKRLGLWLQPGGHADPGESAADAAVRETLEETGVVVSHPEGGPRLLHVDVHEGPRGHVHLDVRYLLRASAGADFAPDEGESQEIGWFTPDEAARMCVPDLVDAFDAVAAQSGR